MNKKNEKISKRTKAVLLIGGVLVLGGSITLGVYSILKLRKSNLKLKGEIHSQKRINDVMTEQVKRAWYFLGKYSEEKKKFQSIISKIPTK